MSTIANAPTSGAGIDHNQAKRLADHVRRHFHDSAAEPSRWDDRTYWNVEASRPDRCQFLAVGNAINFRFWTKRGNQVLPAVGVLDGLPYRGSMYLWRRLRLAIARGEFSTDAGFLRSLSVTEFARAFADEQERLPLEPGLEDRVSNLVDLGTVLLRDWEGQFSNVVDAAQGSLERFAELSESFRAFDDPVRKLTMVNAIMLSGSGLAWFDKDPEPGVDYHLVKHAIRQGLVIPAPSIESKLRNRELLTTEDSLALRTATLRALVDVAELASVSTATLDNLYWLNRRICDEVAPACTHEAGPRCPFESACAQRTHMGLPLEYTRYY